MSCERFQTEGLTGFPVPPALLEHVAGCGDCQQAERSFARLEKLVGVAGRTAAPPAGWEARLDQRLAQHRVRKRKSPIRILVAGAAIAASVLLAVGVSRQPAAARPETIESELLSATGMRGSGATVGSVWQVKVDSGRELRVWRNQKTLVLQCSAANEAGCELSGGQRVARVPLSAPGEYRAMALMPGTTPLADPVSFDEDVRVARTTGATYFVVEPIVVY